MERLKGCIYNSDTPEHFEGEWNQILEEFETVDNDWLRYLYKIREKWVPTYLDHIFFGGQSTTLRIVSMNASLKQCLSYKNTLIGFILRFERGIARQKYLETKEDRESLNNKPKLKSPFPMEKQMAEIYTRKIFFKFQYELWMITACVPQLVKEDEVSCNYVVINLADENEIQRQVVKKKEVIHACCTCKMFEFEGIPCRHVLPVLIQSYIRNLPQHYILKRWTRYAKEKRVIDASGIEI